MIVKAQCSNGWKWYQASAVLIVNSPPVGVQGDCALEFLQNDMPQRVDGETCDGQKMIDMITDKGRTVVFTEGPVFVMNDDGKTIDRM